MTELFRFLIKLFQPTLLMRGATGSGRCACRHASTFQPTLLMRGATGPVMTISLLFSVFQPTLLMRGATCHIAIMWLCIQGFQPTLLMRGATQFFDIDITDCLDFNPRSSCEERRGKRFKKHPFDISTHAPHARSDFMSGSASFLSLFQPTLLMRGATVSLSSIDLLDFIIDFSRTPHLFPKTLLLTLCPVSSISCVMALRA